MCGKFKTRKKEKKRESNTKQTHAHAVSERGKVHVPHIVNWIGE